MAAAGLFSTSTAADVVPVKSFRYAGPFELKTPFMVDSVNVKSERFDTKNLLQTPLSLDVANNGTEFTDSALPSVNGNALHLLTFTIDNQHYLTGKLNVEGLKNYEVYLDGKKLNGNKLAIKPATHRVTIKALTTGQPEQIKVSLDTDKSWLANINAPNIHRITLENIIGGTRMSGLGISPSGKMLATTYTTTNDDARTSSRTVITDAATGKHIATRTERLNWMPKSDLLYFTRNNNGNTELYTLNPLTGAEKLLAASIPSPFFRMAPTEDFIIYTSMQQGPRETMTDMYEIINPEDRQPGWRNRSSIGKYDLKSGVAQPLTFGYHNVRLNDISADGTKIYFTVSEHRFTKRPTTLFSIYEMDLNTGNTRKLVDRDGFIQTCAISPDGRTLAVTGSPESFNGIGKNVPEGRIPSMSDGQLYILDIATGKITPLTKDFNPAVESIEWGADGNIYFTAADRDYSPLFRVNPANGKIENMNVPEEYVTNFAMAAAAPAAAFYGQGASNSDRLYTLNTKSRQSKLADDLSSRRLEGITLGEVKEWSYDNGRGDIIAARYVLPPDFDPGKKYPMIVNYYGGCTPTGRQMETRYPHHLFAANGFVVLVINPSGATGFGQERSSRHVNTAGQGVAEDIITGVNKFVAEHPWINKDKIGNIGASYGGFMTQYLHTKSNIFATGISHAGISDHTSYWGNGYWGYSYSEVSMANSYPWSETDLYVKESPLYNADKVTAPLLLLHGDSDHNVPFGESIQMFTALKLLGKDVKLVAVRDADHQVFDYKKRKQWNDTILAWFTKYLQDDPSWWEALYPEKSL